MSGGLQDALEALDPLTEHEIKYHAKSDRCQERKINFILQNSEEMVDQSKESMKELSRKIGDITSFIKSEADLASIRTQIERLLT